MKYDVYFAAPFFCSGERAQNALLVEALERASLKVFYPQRDGVVAKLEITGGCAVNDVLSDVWLCDTSAIRNASVVMAVLDGRTVDEGVCVEIGYASALSKKIIGYHSDDRSCFSWGMNPMIRESLAEISSDIESSVQAVLRSLIKELPQT